MDTFSSLYPVYLIYTLFGLSSFYTENKGERTFIFIEYYHFRKVIFYLLVFLSISGSSYFDYIYINVYMTENTAIYQLYSVLLSSFKIVFLISIINNEYYGREVMNIWQRISKLDNSIRLHTDYNLRRNSLILLFSGILVIFGSCLYNIMFEINSNSLSFEMTTIMYFVCSAFQTLMQILFCCYILTMKKYLIALNQYYDTLCLHNSPAIIDNQVIASLIKKIAKLHEKILNLSGTINQVYSLPILMNFASNFSFLVINLFRLYTILLYTDYEDLTIASFNSVTATILIPLYNLLIILFSCNSFDDSVSNNFY